MKKYFNDNIRSNSKIEFEIKQSKAKNSKKTDSDKKLKKAIGTKSDEHRISKVDKKSNINTLYIVADNGLDNLNYKEEITKTSKFDKIKFDISKGFVKTKEINSKEKSKSKK